ncbi:hypothetical protein QVD99_000050 [Batrachochytrium dendrobatidis]|nr:hypothetical protein O5D80_003878 [Batrachochytrium dendrobatidis]KAJ8328529.1 hypothetical protein O5D80_003880 [Batrachochytrium dendrobatidis]KAK5664472.1 hypothetical protein QVD99_000050 [Batrachochytrium dendrobatidis]
MKFIDIIFVLTAAATANAVLVSDNGNDLVQASSTSSQVSSPTNEPGPSTPKRGHKRPTNGSGSSAPKRGREQSIDVASSSASSQDQQQPMDEEKPGSTASNQMTGLIQRDQVILYGIKKRLVASKKVERKICKLYHKYKASGSKKQLALERGEDISGSKHNPGIEKRLKEECEKAEGKVFTIRQELEVFTKKHGLKFEEPKADSDSD